MIDLKICAGDLRSEHPPARAVVILVLKCVFSSLVVDEDLDPFGYLRDWDCISDGEVCVRSEYYLMKYTRLVQRIDDGQ